jgi:putative endopeptidase
MRRREFIKLCGATCLSGIGGLTATSSTSASLLPRDPGRGFDVSSIDRSIRPGDDFYRFSNGTWLDRTRIPPDRVRFGHHDALAEAAELHVREILERGEGGVGPSVRGDAIKIGNFYTSFMDEARVEALDVKPIAPALASIVAAKSHSDFTELMGIRDSFYKPLFRVAIVIDPKDSQRYIVHLSQGGLGLATRDYYLSDTFAEKKAGYRTHIAQLLAMVEWPEPDAAAAAIVDFETAIAQASWSRAESRDVEKTSNVLSESRLAQLAPFPWRRFFHALALPELQRMLVAEVSAVPKIADIYANTPLPILKAWQAFHVASGAARFLSPRFVRADFEFYDRTLSGAVELAPRWKRAVGAVNAAMAEAIGRVYVSRHLPPEAKAQVEAMVEEIRIALKARIERLTWMALPTKERALEKLSRVNVKVGHPTTWRDYSDLKISRDDLVGNVLSGRKFEWMRSINRLNEPVDRSEWLRPPQAVNAYYLRSLNEIVLLAGVLQPPFFDATADPATNYAGIGTTIGHELIHGFDDQGRRYDGSGMLSNWWEAGDLKRFSERAAELGRQYDAFERFPGAKVNGQLTMGENIADLGGVAVAFDAYRHSLRGRPAPVVDGFTGDQRFFLSFAHKWRQVIRDDTARRLLVTDVHAPPPFRVNGVVRNMDEWYEAFGVQSQDRLYVAPEERVRIW